MDIIGKVHSYVYMMKTNQQGSGQTFQRTDFKMIFQPERGNQISL